MSKILRFAFIGVMLLAIIALSVTLDQPLSLIPYDRTHNIFYGDLCLWCKFIYYMVPIVTIITILLPIWYLIQYKSTFNPQVTKKAMSIILLSLLLGPGLLVNYVFKNHWGRPRPYQVIRDGKEFSPVWKHNFSQPKDNSFPSGHASIGFFLGVPFLAFGYRKRGILISFIGGSLVGLVRILQGGHYLSDIVFCGILVWIVSEAATYLVNKVMK